jgi:GTP-binding protein Era
MTAEGSGHRSGLVALAGRPNVGKSTLANALAGRHVAAVSPRPQTTRRRVTAVVHGDGWQAVLLDLPGFQRPADRLTERMQRTVDATLADVDAALMVVSAEEGIGPGDRFIAERLRATGTRAIAVVNKVDRTDAAGIARAIAALAELIDPVAVHPVSARTGDGMAELRAELPAVLEEGPAFFPPDMTTDQTEEELAAELIREAALHRLRQEIPHALAVEVLEIGDARTGVRVEAYLIVETESQKRIAIGRGGAMVREIGRAARTELGRLWGEEVHLDLTVKTRRHWRRDDALLDRLGL